VFTTRFSNSGRARVLKPSSGRAKSPAPATAFIPQSTTDKALASLIELTVCLDRTILEMNSVIHRVLMNLATPTVDVIYAPLGRRCAESGIMIAIIKEHRP
ncbi:MAG: hypothetical protein ACREHD_07355, partial [Pirellulales bacterium]